MLLTKPFALAGDEFAIEGGCMCVLDEASEVHTAN
jgi:hypothetical protein